MWQFDPKEQLILIIDDNATNLSVITDYLAQHDFKVMIARSGEIGLKRAKMARPNLILLDVMMPGMDGFETCTCLKADEQTAAIPVIFMTALNDVENKVKGFQVGGVDYITKPLQHEEVLARIQTHLSLQIQAQQLQKQNVQLQQLTQELSKLNRDKDKFFSILAHDLKGPFMPLLGFTELLPNIIGDVPIDEIKRISHQIHNSAQNIYRLLENLLNWSRLQQGRMVYAPVEVDLPQIIEHNLSLLHENANTKRITLKHDVPMGLVVEADMQMLDTVLRNLISNALKFTPTGGQVKVSAQVLEASADKRATVLVSVTDTGIGITEAIRQKLFRIDQQVTQVGTEQELGTGLGLIICQDMVGKHSGRIWVESEVGHGTTVNFTVPLHHYDMLAESERLQGGEVMAKNDLNLVMPSPTELKALWELLSLGNLIAMERRAMQLAQISEIYRPFAIQIQHFARQFDEESIMALLKPHLELADLLDSAIEE